MPNHITNKVRLYGEPARIEQLLKTVQMDGKPLGTVDFNKVIPMPPSLNLTSGKATENNVLASRSWLFEPSGFIEFDAINAYLSAVNPNGHGFEQVEKLDEDTFNTVVDKINSQRSFVKCKTDVDAREIADELERYSEIPDIMSFVNKGKIYVDNTVNYGAANWHDFRVKNWGTKWNSYGSKPVKDDTLTFLTAWKADLDNVQTFALQKRSQ